MIGLWCCMLACLNGPDTPITNTTILCLRFDSDWDDDIDLKDFAVFQNHPPIGEKWERLGD